MAGIRKKGDAYYCTFRFGGKRYYFAVGNVTEAQALAKGAEVDETLSLVERGRLAVPADVALEEFVATGGKVPVLSARPEVITLRELTDQYLKTHANGTKAHRAAAKEGSVRHDAQEGDGHFPLMLELGWAAWKGDDARRHRQGR